MYLAAMNQLPDEVKNEFCEGNFVVKGSEPRFNQVSRSQPGVVKCNW